MGVSKTDRLRQGRESWRRSAWGDAYRALRLADQAAPLPIDDLERLAASAYLTGREAEFRSFLERACHARQEAGDAARAARCAFWVGFSLFLQGESAQANGWLARARRLVGANECAEQGYLLLPVAEQQLGKGDVRAAHSSAGRASEIGNRFSDADLVACARHLQGRALIGLGEVKDGLALLDEAMVPAASGELSPIVAGLVYCSVIQACQEVFALSRAREWTSALGRWCDEQPGMLAFTGACRVYRAEIMQFDGAWQEAMTEASRAGERLAPGAKALGVALYRRGEIHRLRGEFAQADEVYREASRAGCDPQPGLALLRLAEGRGEAAAAAIRRALGAAAEPLERARLLPAGIEIMLATGERQAARGACDELRDIAQRFDTDLLRATAAHARGALEAAEGDAGAAVHSLRRAFETWRQLGAPYESARARVLLGLACRAAGDEEAAQLEFDAAEDAFRRLGAAPDLARLAVERKAAAVEPAQQLTRREREVLRLIAAGKTNKAIAAELRLSERTIDRHVGNILTKLDVPTRAAATASAYARKLL